MTRTERTTHRRAHRLFRQCGAGLQEADRDLCVEHEADRLEALRKYRASAK